MAAEEPVIVPDTRASLVALVDHYAANEGETRYTTPDITFFRLSEPLPPAWSELDALSYCFVAQGAKRVNDGTVERMCDPFQYAVLGPNSRLEVEIVKAEPERPYLSCAVLIDPVVVNEVVDKIRSASNGSAPEDHDMWQAPSCTRTADRIIDATRRLVETLSSPSNGAVLAPVYIREIVYLLLHSEERSRLLTGSRVILRGDPVNSGIRYMKANMHGPLSIASIATAVCMSESSFAHLFKDATGVSPYRYLKSLRLEKARDLMIDSDASVSEAACQVGYSSLSHFVTEFKRHFGATPRVYSRRLRGVGTIDLRQYR